ncbi:MAG: hypothetical protein HC854_01925 [Flavobacterium sp.]|nr:hypothetical protein [Flavobacterium sp.]
MKDNHEFKLVKGQFSPAEARNILFTLINDKIKFHQLDLFSKTERNKTNNIHSKERIKELELSRDNLESFLEELEDKNLKISIDGNITLKLTQ